MSVDVDSRIFGLFQQLLQVAQVVSGNQNSRTFADSGFHLCNLRLTVRSGVRGVEQSHCLDGSAAALQNERGQLIRRKIVRSRGKSFEDKCVNLIILTPEHGGMVCVGGNAFESVGQQLPKRTDILVFARKHAQRSGRGSFPGQLFRPAELSFNAGNVKVRIRDRHEQRLSDKETERTGRRLCLRHDFQLPDEFIHFVCGFRSLAADSAHGAALIPGRFLTLKTEHTHDVSPLLFQFFRFLFGLHTAVDSDNIHFQFFLFSGEPERLFHNSDRSAAARNFHPRNSDGTDVVQTEYFRQLLHIAVQIAVQLRTEDNENASFQQFLVKPSVRMSDAIRGNKQIGIVKIRCCRIQQFELNRPLTQGRRPRDDLFLRRRGNPFCQRTGTAAGHRLDAFQCGNFVSVLLQPSDSFGKQTRFAMIFQVNEMRPGCCGALFDDVLHDAAFIIRNGFALDDAHGSGRTLSDARAKSVAEKVADKPRLSVDELQRAFGAVWDAVAAAVAAVGIDFNDFAFHKIPPERGRIRGTVRPGGSHSDPV